MFHHGAISYLLSKETGLISINLFPLVWIWDRRLLLFQRLVSLVKRKQMVPHPPNSSQLCAAWHCSGPCRCTDQSQTLPPGGFQGLTGTTQFQLLLPDPFVKRYSILVILSVFPFPRLSDGFVGINKYLFNKRTDVLFFPKAFYL